VFNEGKRKNNRTKIDEVMKRILNLMDAIPPNRLRDLGIYIRKKWRGCQRLFEKKESIAIKKSMLSFKGI